MDRFSGFLTPTPLGTVHYVGKLSNDFFPPPLHNCQRGLWMTLKMDLIFPFLIIFRSSRDDLSFRNFKEAMRHEFVFLMQKP